MASDGVASLANQLEGVIYPLERALDRYTENPTESTSQILEQASSDYTDASGALAAMLIARLAAPTDTTRAATRLVALIGLDAAVGIHAGDAAEVVGETDESRGPDVHPGLRRVDDEWRELLPELLSTIREGPEEPLEGTEPPIVENPHYVDREVDELVEQAFDDMSEIVTRAAGPAVPDVSALLHYGSAVLPADLTATLLSISRQVNGWWQVCRRLAVRAWGWITAKLTALLGRVGSDAVRRAIGNGVDKAKKVLTAKLLGNALGAPDVANYCNRLLSAHPRKVKAGVNAAARRREQHRKTRRWVAWAANGLGLLSSLTFAVGGVSLHVSFVAAIVLLVLSYAVAYDFLASNAWPHGPKLFEGIGGAVAAVV
jgi:hypothetical protein